ncbi:hypothetical protein RhiirB3_445107 [Rhizophagus irregularis]|nr:hypothetical protein RhiirB3_445107 [Rhizophagus irregularis]
MFPLLLNAVICNLLLFNRDILQINYNDVSANSSDNNFPTFYIDTNYSDQQPIYNGTLPCVPSPQQTIEAFLLHLITLI